MSSKRSLPDWHEDTGFHPDMSLFDGPSDKIIDKTPLNSAPTSQETKGKWGKTAAWRGISGVSGLGKTFQMRNPLDSIINDDPETADPEKWRPTMEQIISELPPKPVYRRIQPPQKKGGASRKMRKSRRMRRVKSQMRRKNSSRKSTRRRTRK